jgi:plasmid stabilization system protein ParE
LDDAVGYVAEDSSMAAEGLLLKVLDAAGSLVTFSECGRLVPSQTDRTIREILVDPFRLLYQGRTAEVVILVLPHR